MAEARAAPVELIQPPSTIPAYRITLDIDVGGSTYWGQETVRYTNTGRRPLQEIWFLLSPNIGSDSDKGMPPLLYVQSVEVAGAATQFEVHESTSVKINLSEPLRPGESVELTLEFFGKVPELDREATTLSAHFTEQVSQVIDSRHHRVYQDPPFFVSDQVLVLSGFYPVLAPRPREEWQVNVPRAADEVSFTEAADYQVKIRVPGGLSVYTSGEQVASEEKPGKRVFDFRGRGLRDFLVIAGPNYRTESQTVGSVVIQSVFRPEDEVVGQQVLRYAVHALAAYQTWFGPYPYSHLKLVEAPLPAGRMSAEAACMVALANAYFVDFQSSRGFALPGLIRENAPLIEDAVEFNVAYTVARQWWGMSVGFDPERAHFLDNALATYGALLYYEKTYGPAVAQDQIDAQLKAAYRVYRMFGGDDKPVNQPVSRFTNSFQYAAIVHVKGALFFGAVRRVIGDKALAAAFREYFRAHCFGRTDVPDLLRALRRAAGDRGDQIFPLYTRWITWRQGDQDIAKPEYRIIVSTGMSPSQEDRPSAFEWLGRFIARQMTRVGKYTVKPF